MQKLRIENHQSIRINSMTKDITETLAYKEWLSKQELSPVDNADIKRRVIADLKFSAPMSQFEYTLYQKWQSIQAKYGNADKPTLQKIKRVKRKIWAPENPDDYLKLEPELVVVKQEFPVRHVSIWGQERYMFMTNPDPLEEDWTIMSYFVSTARAGGTVGRNIRMIVRDKKTKKYLGILCLSSDFFGLTGRDNAIGWSTKTRIDENMIQHTGIGSVIVPTQPFGFDYLGGKLLSLLLVSDVVANAWEDIYGTKLIGVTTTSLYGKEKPKGTQYDGLTYWKNYGFTSGSTVLKPSLETAAELKEWMKNNYPEDYFKFYRAQREGGLPLVRDSTERARNFCYKKLGIKDAKSDHNRGIYFSRLYKNSFEFLRKEITNTNELKPGFDNSVDSLVDVWKTRHLKKRPANLAKDNRFRTDVEFYDELTRLSWDQTKERYLR